MRNKYFCYKNVFIKVFSLILCILMLILSTACGDQKKNNQENSDISTETEYQNITSNEIEENINEESKTNQEIKTEHKNVAINDAQIGETITFGTYEQDNDFSNGKEDIEWQVLDKSDGKILVISKYALNRKQYNTELVDITWETCDLRKWLNNDFLNIAFSEEEQKRIPTVVVSADKNPDHSTNPGNVTKDKIFLLSIPEANKYFASDDARICQPTPYAIANYTWELGGNACWWLRSPGNYQDIVTYVDNCGEVCLNGNLVNDDGYSFRPALWINL